MERDELLTSRTHQRSTALRWISTVDSRMDDDQPHARRHTTKKNSTGNLLKLTHMGVSPVIRNRQESVATETAKV